MKDKLKELEKKIAEAQRDKEEKSNFIQRAVHDLKNPMSAIKGSAIMINSTPEDAELIYNFSQLIVEAADEVLHAVNRILNYDELKDLEAVVTLRKVSLKQMMDRIIKLNNPQANFKGQSISLEIKNSDIIFDADEEKFFAAVDNILSNAVKYSPLDSKIDIHAETRNDLLRIEIIDEGLGFTDEDLKKAFGKYQKLSAKPTGGETSSGLGLSIVKRIIQLHKGKVWIERKKNKGSLFIIEIPLIQKNIRAIK